MTDERPTTVVALSGAPAGWRATLRDLLRHLRADSPDREGVREWLREQAEAPDGADPADQLAFLEAAGLLAVDGPDGRVQPGPAGREFLDTHDEGVLYGALAGAAGGLGTLLESLAVRPLTDVEFRDLLERAYDADVPPEEVRAHRQWLEALGYVEHDDGVNDLTRSGRRRVKTDDDLSPPGADRPGGQPASRGGGSTAGEAGEAGPDVGRGDAPGEVAGGTSASDGAPNHDRATGSDGPAVPDTGTGAAPDTATGAAPGSGSGDGPAGDEAGTAAQGDEDLESLKRRYDYTCAVCGDRRQRSPTEGYARVHHPMPADGEHGGPAEPANAVVVCPNHHADFRRGLLRVDPQTLEIEHAYEERVSGRTLATVEGHDLGAQYLAYHDEVVADF